MPTELTYEETGGVGVVTLQRPAARNFLGGNVRDLFDIGA